MLYCVYGGDVYRYPDNLAWHIPLSRAFIRKSPEVSKFHRFLVDESDQVQQTLLTACSLSLSRSLKHTLSLCLLLAGERVGEYQ